MRSCGARLILPSPTGAPCRAVRRGGMTVPAMGAAGTVVSTASFRRTGSCGPAGMFRGRCLRAAGSDGGAAGGGARRGTGRCRSGGAEDGFVGTHQFVVEVSESANRPVHGRRRPPGTLAPLLCRCHNDHLFVMQDGLLVRPPVLDRTPLRRAGVQSVEGWWRTPGGRAPGETQL